jgi:hypothetical protein
VARPASIAWSWRPTQVFPQTLPAALRAQRAHRTRGAKTCRRAIRKDCFFRFMTARAKLKPGTKLTCMPMFMAVLTVEFSLDGNDNLKAKRRVANSLKQKTRNKFNVAVAEVGTEDSLTRLRVAVVSLSNNETHLRSRMDKCALMMEAVCPEEMIDSQVEIYVTD